MNTTVLTYNGLKTYDELIKGFVTDHDEIVSDNAQHQIDDITDEQSEHDRRIRVLEQDTAITIAELDAICV